MARRRSRAGRFARERPYRRLRQRNPGRRCSSAGDPRGSGRLWTGTYPGLDSDLAPIEEGPLTIRLSSPEHQLVVHRNRLRLVPNRRGGLDATVEIELEGEGRLHADVEGAGRSGVPAGSRFSDDVAVPRQTVRARGEVRLERAADGYRFTVERPGAAAALAIESGIAGQVVGVCRALAVLPFIDLGCDRLEVGLSVIHIPLPEPGTVLLLPADGLAAEERAFFDRLANAATSISGEYPPATLKARGAR